MTEQSHTGFYGKLPSLGDFVSRRLPREFIDALDAWLQDAIDLSRQQLLEGWMDKYLISPVWSFALSPGLAGETGWLAVMMPSVDRVGRYFPFVIAQPVAPGESIIKSLARNGEWFARANQLIYTGLDDTAFDLEQFDAQVAALADVYVESVPAGVQPAADFGLGWRLGTVDLPDAHEALLTQMLASRLAAFSVWWTEGSQFVESSYLVSSGLPEPLAYTAMLSGDWQTHGWSDWGPIPSDAPVHAEAVPVAAQPAAVEQPGSADPAAALVEDVSEPAAVIEPQGER